MEAPEWVLGGKAIELCPHFAAAVAAVNGGFSGGRSIYNFKDGSGFLAFAADSSWSLDDTLFGDVFQALGSNYDPSSAGTNRTIYQDGAWFDNKVGTEGNVTIQLSANEGAYNHEGIHVLQSHIFGPTFTELYVGASVLEGIAGLGIWAVNQAEGQHKDLGQQLEWYGYYENPFELWAYTQNQGDWDYQKTKHNP